MTMTMTDAEYEAATDVFPCGCLSTPEGYLPCPACNDALAGDTLDAEFAEVDELVFDEDGEEVLYDEYLLDAYMLSLSLSRAEVF